MTSSNVLLSCLLIFGRIGAAHVNHLAPIFAAAAKANPDITFGTVDVKT